MNNKYLLLLILFCLIGIEIYTVYNYEPTIEIVLGIGSLAGIAFIFYNSELVRTRYFWFMIAGCAAILIGALMIILHLPGARAGVLAGSLLIIVAYTARFINKQDKKRVDVLKLLLLLSCQISGPVIATRLIPSEYRVWVMAGSQIILWICLIDFIYEMSLEKTPGENDPPPNN